MLFFFYFTFIQNGNFVEVRPTVKRYCLTQSNNKSSSPSSASLAVLVDAKVVTVAIVIIAVDGVDAIVAVVKSLIVKPFTTQIYTLKRTK